MTDFHTHILPGIDDGSRSAEESLTMLRAETAQGIRRVVLTPHFYPWKDSPKAFLEKRDAAQQDLMRALAECPDADKLPRLSFGAEVHYFDGISQAEALPELAIDSKRCVLIEMPQGVWSERMYRELEAIHTERGLLPVLAHLERYLLPLTAGGVLKKLAALPVFTQVNASFFLQRSTRHKALKMLETGNIHLLGSDCHNTSGRAPNLGDALAVITNAADGRVLERIQSRCEKLLGE